MRRIYVMVEGPNDEAVLRRILPAEVQSGVTWVDAEGSSEIPSLARSLIVTRRCPMAVIMDSGSVNPDVTEERRQSVEELIRLADPVTPLKVVAAVPEIEAWFLAAPQAIERVFGQKPSEEWFILGKGDPRGALRWMAEKSRKQWDINQAIQTLDERDVEQIRAIPEVTELSMFLREMQKNGHDGTLSN